ncbi:hypothetical protein Pyn_16102 [Prunus yedoensis var. nudiflora]|uniref:Secreted protein n=1 Tax=Prunus yedoensis var. nudiflora TaxID=2094558 RepID=A0A314XSM2_PRUYE|nr:hypothetical protein Pyn_16102 [Prunus yedoensis var. nudiflora]
MWLWPIGGAEVHLWLLTIGVFEGSGRFISVASPDDGCEAGTCSHHNQGGLSMDGGDDRVGCINRRRGNSRVFVLPLLLCERSARFRRGIRTVVRLLQRRVVKLLIPSLHPSDYV